MAPLSGRLLVVAMCLGQVGNLLPRVVVPAVMPQHLMPLWGLSTAEAGLMASAYAFGYMVAVPLLATLTDRIDARRILLVGSALSGLATAMFGFIADGLWSATLIWGLAGVGFAGAYMPGLKALADRLPPGESSRSITLYTGSFSIGVGLSFLVAQLVADGSGWRAAFYVTSTGRWL
jgi:MFS family permease